MVIQEVRADDIIARCRYALGLPTLSPASIDDEMLAALVRRAAGILCPCARVTLRTSLMESLNYLAPDETLSSERIDGIVEGLIVGGDLLELSGVTAIDPAVKGTWVFAAPPSYVVRPHGSVFLIGVVPDQDTFLPYSLASRIIYEGLTRAITLDNDEDLVESLREQGLQELPENVWLKAPRAETAEKMLVRMEHELASQPRSGTIQGLQILDPTRPVTYYKGRWTAPNGHSGNFVGRRPQDFGASLWCFVSVEDGAPVRILDLPQRKTRWRGCDLAWHLQMAIDCLGGTRQVYRRGEIGDVIRLDFHSPLPQWCQRRLMIFGRPMPSDGSLISYELAAEEAEIEEHFLQERLWLTRK